MIFKTFRNSLEPDSFLPDTLAEDERVEGAVYLTLLLSVPITSGNQYPNKSSQLDPEDQELSEESSEEDSKVEFFDEYSDDELSVLRTL